MNIRYKDASITQDELSDTLESIMMGESLSSLRGFHTREDVGGVAGFSSGEVFSCVNKGTVGYDHVGYNTGGVVGRSTGFVRECINRGEVYGRKDVGGVVGQQQPYMELSFSEGDLGELHSEVEALSGLINRSLTNASGYSADTTQRLLGITDMTDEAIGDIDSMADKASAGADDLTDTAEDTIDLGRVAVDDADRYISDVLDAVDDLTDELARKDDQLAMSAEELSALNQSITDARSALRSTRDIILRVSQLPIPGTDRTLTVPDLQKMASSFKAAVDQAQELLISVASIPDDGLQDAMEELEDTVNDEPGFYDNAMGIIDSVDEFRKNTSDLNRDLRDSGTELYHTVGEITQEVGHTISEVNGNVQGAVNDLKSIQAQANRITDKMNSILEDAADPDRYTKDRTKDVSAEDIAGATDGRTSQCVNRGLVDADYNVGGITGLMGFELDLDPEDDIEEEGTRSYDYVLRTKCIVDHSQNEGAVHANRNISGGVAGRMELGLAIADENYGDVTADDDYAGGICGYSRAEIADCYAKQYVSASRYVGGIAGYGEELRGCVAMPNMGGSAQYIGGIAGNVADVNREDIHDNRYYAREMHGIDGVSYTGIAEGIDYQTLRKLPNIPQAFYTLSLRFMVDEEEIGTVICEYGQALPEKKIPSVPRRDGFIGSWKKKDFSNITEDERIEAKYTRVVTLIESDAKRDSGRPVLLAKGTFQKGDALEVTAAEPARGQDVEGWRVTVPDDGNASHTFRYLPDKDDQIVRILVSDENGSRFTEAKTGEMGKYVTFEAEGSSFVFSVDEYWEGTFRAVASLCVLLAIAGLVIFVIRFKKGKILLQRLIRYVRKHL